MSDPERLFSFVQFEFPRELGPADGRYVVREGTDADASHVLVLRTVGKCSARPAPDARLYLPSLHSHPESQLRIYRLLSRDWTAAVQALAGWLPLILQMAAVM